MRRARSDDVCTVVSGRLRFLALSVLLASIAGLVTACSTNRDSAASRPGVYSIRLDGSDRKALGFRADFLAAGPRRRILFLDGTRLGIANEDGSRRRILGRFRPWPGDPYAAWSPDGRWIAIVRGSDCDVICIHAPTLIVDPETGSVQARLPGCVDPSWSPTGMAIACWRYAGFDPSNDSDLTDVLVFRRSDRRGQRIAHGCCPSWSPNGEILYMPQGARGGLHAIRPDGTRDRLVGSGWGPTTKAPSPDGTKLGLVESDAVRAEGIYAIPTRRGRVRAIDTARPGYASYGDTGAHSLTWSSSGLLLAWAIEWLAGGRSSSPTPTAPDARGR